MRSYQLSYSQSGVNNASSSWRARDSRTDGTSHSASDGLVQLNNPDGNQIVKTNLESRDDGSLARRLVEGGNFCNET